MAGAGYKLFVNGNTLSASDLNTYLQQQTVMVFASASARTTALASVLAEGMVSYRTDSHIFEIYNGSAWVSAGISSPLTTKGDLWGYDTAGNRIPVGSNNQVLTADSTQALGVKWATPVSGSLTSIATGTFSGASTTISSIPQTYSYLYLLIQGIYSSTANEIKIAPNNDSANAYSTGTYNGAVRTNSATSIRSGNGNGLTTANTNSSICIINNYTSTTQSKPFFFYGSENITITGTFGFTGDYVGTSAITSLVITMGTTLSGGTYTLYGVN